MGGGVQKKIQAASKSLHLLERMESNCPASVEGEKLLKGPRIIPPISNLVVVPYLDVPGSDRING